MTRQEILNEHFKLVANWFNTLATGVFTAGVFVPAVQFILICCRARTTVPSSGSGWFAWRSVSPYI